MKARIVLAIIVGFAVVFAATGRALADHTDTVSTSAPVYGTLVGNGAGAFWTMQIAYPGGSASPQITIRMNFHPADPIMQRGVGFNMYDSGGFLLGKGVGVSDNQDTIHMSYAREKAETLTLQVYNDIAGIPINFTVRVEGLPETAAVLAAPAAAPASAAAPRPAAASAPMAGSLAGSASGTFAKFWVKYNTAVKAVLTMTYSPADPIINRGVAIRIYGPSGEVAKSTDTAENSVAHVSFGSVAGAMYLIQVEN